MIGYGAWKKGFPMIERLLEKQMDQFQAQIKEAQDQVKDARGEVKQEREYGRLATAEFLKSLSAIDKSMITRDEQFEKMATEFRRLADKDTCKYSSREESPSVPKKRR